MQPIPEDSDLLSSSAELGMSSTSSHRGVIFGRTVRSSFACLHVAMMVDSDASEDDISEIGEHVLLRLQFDNDLSALRSFCRRFCKLGDLVLVHGAEWKSIVDDDRRDATEWQAPRLVMDLSSSQEAPRRLVVEEAHYWSMRQCQKWQQEYLPIKPMKGALDDSVATKPPTWLDQPCSDAACTSHGGGLAKREQGEYLANFLINMIIHKLLPNELTGDCVSWCTSCPEPTAALRTAIDWLNRGSGVIDAAGGSGHVSMALGKKGVHSTVVDPRENVGRLPGRDRKVWNRMLRAKRQKVEDDLYCEPVEYGALRAWFGAPPTGVDKSHRHPDKEQIPVCGFEHDLLQKCSAIVALHPDEATDAAVDAAVQSKTPFAIVPCCVFSRLFPNRKLPGTNQPVSTYQDLLDYLAGKHVSIKRAELPFEGANTILWCTF